MNRRQFLKYSLLSGVSILAGSYPVLIERNWVQINHYQIPIPGLPLAFHGFRLAHLTDLHFGFLVSEAFIQGIVAKTKAIQADAIICTGDYVHARNTTEEINRVWPIFMQLEAQYGVYSVLGNHDHWADTARSLYWLERSGQDLRNQSKVITKGNARLLIGGTGDFWEDRTDIDKAFIISDEHDCRVLLAHNPDSVDTEFNTPISLVLSGHTHGGQVIVPFYGAPILPVHNKTYSSGLIQTPKTQLFISRGLGWSIMPIRFNCFPEIAVLELLSPTALRKT